MTATAPALDKQPSVQQRKSRPAEESGLARTRVGAMTTAGGC